MGPKTSCDADMDKLCPQTLSGFFLLSSLEANIFCAMKSGRHKHALDRVLESR
jgi:hypothetical protein